VPATRTMQLTFENGRWLDTYAGRLVSRDPLGFNAADPNAYRYQGNRPYLASNVSSMLSDGAGTFGGIPGGTAVTHDGNLEPETSTSTTGSGWWPFSSTVDRLAATRNGSGSDYSLAWGYDSIFGTLDTYTLGVPLWLRRNVGLPEYYNLNDYNN